jgi:hypothetical protein
MSAMIVKRGEVICIASGVFEGYDRAGPFVVAQEFDLNAFIDLVKTSVAEPWEISTLMYDIPRLLVEQGLISKMPCRNVYLGAFGEFDVGEEKEFSA